MKPNQFTNSAKGRKKQSGRLAVKLLMLICVLAFAETAQAQSDTLPPPPAAKSKKGWTFGALPAVAFDSDLGFRYGGLVNFFNYGDGSSYPKYLHSVYLEVSRTTKGSGTNQFFFDSEHVLPKRTRLTVDLSYLTEQAVDFYGFNGYQAAYLPAFENQSDPQYISRMYYRHARNMLRFTADAQNKLSGNFRWFAGIGHFTIKTDAVDIDRLNKGKDANEMLPDTLSLFDKYVAWGLIPQQDADGGVCNLVKTGLVYDTRDNEANPMKGVWSELLFVAAPRFFGNSESPFTRVVAIHRQYHTLAPEVLNLAVRVSYHGTLSGTTPYYMAPYLFTSFSQVTINEGLGGAKSVRGMLRNRTVGQSVAYGNLELRYKFLRTRIARQNLYLAVNAFSDAGMVVVPQKIDKSLIPAGENPLHYFDELKDKPHITVGGGLHIALNDNFVVSVNYGRATDPRDGKSGLYIGMNWLY